MFQQRVADSPDFLFKGVILTQDEESFEKVPRFSIIESVTYEGKIRNQAMDSDLHKYQNGEYRIHTQLVKLNVERLDASLTETYLKNTHFSIIPIEWKRIENDEKYRNLTNRCFKLADSVVFEGRYTRYAFVIPEPLDKPSKDALNESIRMSVEGSNGQPFVVSDGPGYKERMEFAIESLGTMCIAR